MLTCRLEDDPFPLGHLLIGMGTITKFLIASDKITAGPITE